MKNIYLSNSAIDKYELCPRLFKYHYIEKIRSNITTSALVFGSAIDESVDFLFSTLDKKESIRIFKEKLNKNFNKDIHIYKKDFDWNTLNQEDVDHLNNMKDSREKELEFSFRSLKGKGVDFINKLNDEFIENIDSVIDSQLKVTIKNGKYIIIGFIDFILKMKDGSILLVDLKTSGKSYSDRMLEESHQLHLYDFCLNLMKDRGEYTKDMPEKIAYLVLRKDYNTKGQMRDIQFKITKPNKDFSLQSIKRFDTLIESIESEVFPKTDKKYNCTHQFGKKCDYFDICKGNKTLDEIDHLECKK